MDAVTERLIWERAGRICEYCHLPADFHPAPFQIDHVIARKHHGDDDVENLALACLRCNSYKGSNIAGIDPDSGMVTTLFHPRKDDWFGHFKWEGAVLRGMTAIGRTTIDVLKINDPDAVRVRDTLIEEGRFEG